MFKDESNLSIEKKKNQWDMLSLIPDSVIATLTHIQRSQLRRSREMASFHLEKILRNVVKKIDLFYADQTNRHYFFSAKKNNMGKSTHEVFSMEPKKTHLFLATFTSESEEERVNREIMRILNGDIDDFIEDNRNATCTKDKENENVTVAEPTEVSLKFFRILGSCLVLLYR